MNFKEFLDRYLHFSSFSGIFSELALNIRLVNTRLVATSFATNCATNGATTAIVSYKVGGHQLLNTFVVSAVYLVIIIY